MSSKIKFSLSTLTDQNFWFTLILILFPSFDKSLPTYKILKQKIQINKPGRWEGRKFSCLRTEENVYNQCVQCRMKTLRKKGICAKVLLFFFRKISVQTITETLETAITKMEN